MAESAPLFLHIVDIILGSLKNLLHLDMSNQRIKIQLNTVFDLWKINSSLSVVDSKQAGLLLKL